MDLIEQIVKDFVSLEEEYDRIGKQRKKAREEVIKLCKDAGNILKTDKYEVMLEEVPKQRFRLKDAMAVLDARVLRPFITRYKERRLKIETV